MIANEHEALEWISQFTALDAPKLSKLQRFCALLTEENTRQNLVSQSSLAEIWRRHIVDSAQLLLHVPRETIGSWLDLGAGAGFPGIVIAILLPHINVTMVESRAKRIAWLNHLRITLDLPNAEVLGSRLELVDSRNFDVISARAFAPLEKLLPLSARFSTAATHFVLPKGRGAAQELSELSLWQHSFHVKPSVTDSEAGIICGHLLGKLGKKR